MAPPSKTSEAQWVCSVILEIPTKVAVASAIMGTNGVWLYYMAKTEAILKAATVCPLGKASIGIKANEVAVTAEPISHCSLLALNGAMACL